MFIKICMPGLIIVCVYMRGSFFFFVTKEKKSSIYSLLSSYYWVGLVFFLVKILLSKKGIVGFCEGESVGGFLRALTRLHLFSFVNSRSQTRPRLRSLWSRQTRSACSGRTSARRSYCSACSGSVWRPNVSACALVGWIGRRRLSRSGRRRRVFLPYATACAPAAAKADWRLYCTRDICAWGREWGCAWPAPALTRIPCRRWDTCAPSCCRGCGGSACVCSGWMKWRRSFHTRCRCVVDLRCSPRPLLSPLRQLFLLPRPRPSSSSGRQIWRTHPWCSPRWEIRSRCWSIRGPWGQTEGCPGVPGPVGSTPLLRCWRGSTADPSSVSCRPASPLRTQKSWCNLECSLQQDREHEQVIN